MLNVHEHPSLEPAQSTSGLVPPTTPIEAADELPAPKPPPFALRSDGRLLLGVDALADRDLTGCELWTGLVLRGEEEAYVFERAENAAHEIAAKVIGKIPRLKAPEAPEEVEEDQASAPEEPEAPRREQE